MAINFNKQDVNQATGSAFQQIFRRGPVIAYDIIKWLVDFANQMVKMVTGK